MSGEPPIGFMTLPAPGDRALGVLRKKLALLALHTLLTLPRERAAELRAPLARVQSALERIARSDGRGALVAALGRVDVLVPILCLRSGQLPPRAALSAAIPALCVALARAGVREPISWDVPFARLPDAGGARVLELTREARGLLLDAHGLELRLHEGAPLWLPLDADPDEHASLRVTRPFHPLLDGSATPVLALLDTNPLALLEEHPDKSGNALSLGDRPLEQWRSALGDALGLVEVALPALHEEMVAALERVVPVGFEPERHLSASYREAPGLVYLTLHPSPLTLAEALIHETQHGKLNVLRWFDSLLENGDDTWSRSPVRPDLRPLSGVLLAVHAFVPVAAFHRVLAEQAHPLTASPDFARRRDEVLDANARGLKTLTELGRPTALGKRIIAALEELQGWAGAAR
jgi:HEXXH motif-containing protein